MSALELGFTRTLAGASYAVARQRIEASLRGQGFGVATGSEVKAVVQAQWNAEFPNYVIVGECPPPGAVAASRDGAGHGILLPCNVVVTEGRDGRVSVSILDPESVLRLLDDPASLREPMREARIRLQRALERA